MFYFALFLVHLTGSLLLFTALVGFLNVILKVVEVRSCRVFFLAG